MYIHVYVGYLTSYDFSCLVQMKLTCDCWGTTFLFACVLAYIGMQDTIIPIGLMSCTPAVSGGHTMHCMIAQNAVWNSIEMLSTPPLYHLHNLTFIWMYTLSCVSSYYLWSPTPNKEYSSCVAAEWLVLECSNVPNPQLVMYVCKMCLTLFSQCTWTYTCMYVHVTRYLVGWFCAHYNNTCSLSCCHFDLSLSLQLPLRVVWLALEFVPKMILV